MERKEKAGNIIKKLAAEFLERENETKALITVTRADVSPDLKKATVFITVLPESQEAEVLKFAKRRRSDLRDLLKKKIVTKFIPFLEVEIDLGEKNRQKIDELLR